jgi:exopolysaccharide production protein ExoZ
MGRLSNLDYLRGLAAFGIMIYHYLSWTTSGFLSDTFMGRVGTYGVSIFYVLSGLTLYYVYYNKMNFTKEDLFSFFKKRIFRILPLLWLTTIISILLSKKIPDLTNIFLNLTGLFGFFRWDKYLSPGAWSIGNELVFYVFFPFFILFVKRAKTLMIILALVLFVLYLYFAFSKLSPDVTLAKQWKIYVNPLNQVFLFLGGFLIGLFFHSFKAENAHVITLLFLGLLLFTFYPVVGDRINIVIGINRLVFTACCFIICFCFYKLTFQLPHYIHTPLTTLGEISYSVYLLHPIVFKIIFYCCVTCS